MAYDEGVAQRLRARVGPLPGLTEKRMFGGISYLLRGNMVCGFARRGVDRPGRAGAARGRPGSAWCVCSTSAANRWRAGSRWRPRATHRMRISRWVKLGVYFAGSLPAK